MGEAGEGGVIRGLSAVPLLILLALVLVNYLFNGLPYIPDSWVHLNHSETILSTGYLFGPSPNPSRVSYNYQWPTVNLLLALSQLILGLSPLQSFYVVSILAVLSVVPFVLFTVRASGDYRVGVIAGVLFSVLSVKILVDTAVMKETAAQYPFYAFILATYIALTSGEGLRRNLVVMVLTFIAILFAHHFTLLMALAYSLVLSLTVLINDYLRLKDTVRNLSVVGAILGLGALTYLWYMDYLRAFEVTSFVTPGLVSIPLLITVLLLDYVSMRREARVTIYVILSLVALVLIALFAVGVARPFILQGFNKYVILSSVSYVLPIVMAVLYVATRGFGNPVITTTTIISIAMIVYVLLMGNNPLELLFLVKTLDYTMPFLAIPTAMLVVTAMGRGRVGKAVGSTILLALAILLPIFALLTLLTYSLPTSSTLVVYRLVDYEEISTILHLGSSQPIYASMALDPMVHYIAGINALDPTAYLLHGSQPPGLLVLRYRDLNVGFLYGSGYSMVSIPREYLVEVLSHEDLIYSGNFVRAWLSS